MTTESIQLNVPSILYQSILGTAKRSQREVHDILLEAINHVFGSISQLSDSDLNTRVDESALNQLISMPFVHPRQAEMEAEVAVFEATHDVLWAAYPNQFIAMYQSTIVDHDDDESLLIERIDEKYADDIVLIRQVQLELPPVLMVRSPRLRGRSGADIGLYAGES